MSPSEKQQQIIRFIAGGSVTLFMLAIIVLTATTLNRSLYHLLWGMPVIAVSLLDIYFLSRSLLQKPKTIDVRLSSLLIGLGTTFGFSVAVMVLSPQQAAHLYVVALRNPNHYFTMHVIDSYGNILVSPCVLHKAQHVIRLLATKS